MMQYTFAFIHIERSMFICSILVLICSGAQHPKQITVQHGGTVYLFDNPDNKDKEVTVYIKGDRDNIILATFIIKNGTTLSDWKDKKYRKLVIDSKGKVVIFDVDEQYQGHYYIYIHKFLSYEEELVELVVLVSSHHSQFESWMIVFPVSASLLMISLLICCLWLKYKKRTPFNLCNSREDDEGSDNQEMGTLSSHNISNNVESTENQEIAPEIKMQVSASVSNQTSDVLREILIQDASDSNPETQTMMKYEMLCHKDNLVFGDIPLSVHQKMATSCSFLPHNAVVNIPLRTTSLPQSATYMHLAIQRSHGSNQSHTTQGESSLSLPSSEQNHVRISNGPHKILVTNKGSPPKQLVSTEGQNVLDNQQTAITITDSVKEPSPKFPQYAVKNMRISSFTDWSLVLLQRPEEMAECG